ncbi:MAG: 30S ribosomal protein S20 [Planctomycetota bacterium]
MPNTESAKKRLRQTAKRTANNKTLRSAMRTFEKRILERVEAGDKAGAEAMLPDVYQHLDKAAKKRIIHPNTAANHKSRIAKKIAAL